MTIYHNKKDNKMLAELPGYTVARSIPDNVVLGLLQGTYKLFGGVVRDQSGKIISHLIPASGMLLSGNPVTALAVEGVKTASQLVGNVQLHQIGKDVSQILTIAQTSMAISGLTLAVSAAGFIFLNNKLNLIEKQLHEIAKDVKSIKKFLELEERGRLITALKQLRDYYHIEEINIKTELLLSSRQTFGEIHEKYKSLLCNECSAEEFISIEEFYVITALGYTQCSAELGLLEQARNELEDSQKIWLENARGFVQSKALGNSPNRFFSKKYVSTVQLEEVAVWEDFAKGTEEGIGNLNEMRKLSGKLEMNISKAPDKQEQFILSSARKLVERSKVISSYIDQYKYFSSIKQKPSEIQEFFEGLSKDCLVNNFHILLASEHHSINS